MILSENNTWTYGMAGCFCSQDISHGAWMQEQGVLPSGYFARCMDAPTPPSYPPTLLIITSSFNKPKRLYINLNFQEYCT